MLIGLFALISCAPKDNEAEVASLQLSKTTLTFDKLGGNESVTITTNQDKWSYYSAQEDEWLSFSMEGKALKVTANPNPKGKNRTGVIQVTAGGLTERIKVSQVAADTVLDLTPGELTFPQKGGEMRISVASNADTWEIETTEAVEWLKLSKSGHLVFVTAEPNGGQEPRQAVLLAKSGTKQAEVLVKQMATEKYMLPLYELESSQDVMRHEVARGGILLDFREPSSYMGNTLVGQVSILPNCPLFDYFIYTYEYAEPKKWDNIFLQATSWEEVTSKEFIAYLETYGFKQDKEGQDPKKLLTFRNADETLMITMIKEKIALGIKFEDLIYIDRIIKQDKDYPTFTTLPQQMHKFLDNKEQKVDAINKWAKENGYEIEYEKPNPFNRKQTELTVYQKKEPKGEEADAFMAFWYCDYNGKKIKPELEGVLQQYQVVYLKDLNRMMWHATGKYWRVTKEYDALVRKSGYPELKEEHKNDNTFFYGDDKDNYAMVGYAIFRGLFDGAPTVRTAYWNESPNKHSAYITPDPTPDKAEIEFLRDKAKNTAKYIK